VGGKAVIDFGGGVCPVNGSVGRGGMSCNNGASHGIHLRRSVIERRFIGAPSDCRGTAWHIIRIYVAYVQRAV